MEKITLVFKVAFSLRYSTINLKKKKKINITSTVKKNKACLYLKKVDVGLFLCHRGAVFDNVR